MIPDVANDITESSARSPSLLENGAILHHLFLFRLFSSLSKTQTSLLSAKLAHPLMASKALLEEMAFNLAN